MYAKDFDLLNLKTDDLISLLFDRMVFKGRFQGFHSVAVNHVFDIEQNRLLVQSQDPGQPPIDWVFDLGSVLAIGKVREPEFVVAEELIITAVDPETGKATAEVLSPEDQEQRFGQPECLC